MSASAGTRLDDVGRALVQAADLLLAREGSAGLTVRRIAAEAGVSTMNVYSRFGGKDGVVEQLYVQGFELLFESVGAVAETADPMADLGRCGSAYRTFALAHPTLYAVMFDRVVADFEPSPVARATALGTLHQLAQRLERAMDAGQLRRMAPMHAAAVVWSTCHGVVSLELKHVGDASLQWDTVFADATRAVMQGLST